MDAACLSLCTVRVFAQNDALFVATSHASAAALNPIDQLEQLAGRLPPMPLHPQEG